MSSLVDAPSAAHQTADATRAAAASARRRTALAWNLGAASFIWLTSLVVIALWVHGAGIQSLVAFNAGTLTTLGRLAGLVSANLLLYQLLLMARVPLFERGFGRDGITRMHRLVGFWSFWLLLAHILLVTLGSAATANANVLVQIWDFIWDYPGMLLATVGTLLLVMVVVTSIRRARRKLRYESWHLVHLYGYLGAGLAVPHMIWTGADFSSSTLASVYWWALWAAAVGCALVWRVGVPVARTLRHRIRVASVEQDGPRGLIVRMTGRELAGLGAEPGQFFVWRFLDGPGWMRAHPFSLAAAPGDKELCIAVRRVGDGTERMARLRPGTRVAIEGPYGTLTGARRTGSRLLMIGAGAGITPLVALLEGEAFAPGEAVLVTRDRDDAERMLRGPVARLVAERGLTHYALTGPRAAASSPWLPASHAAWDGAELLRFVAPELAEFDVYLCGAREWTDAVHADLRRAGVPAGRIHTESFSV